MSTYLGKCQEGRHKRSPWHDCPACLPAYLLWPTFPFIYGHRSVPPVPAYPGTVPVEIVYLRTYVPRYYLAYHLVLQARGSEVAWTLRLSHAVVRNTGPLPTRIRPLSVVSLLSPVVSPFNVCLLPPYLPPNTRQSTLYCSVVPQPAACQLPRRAFPPLITTLNFRPQPRSVPILSRGSARCRQGLWAIRPQPYNSRSYRHYPGFWPRKHGTDGSKLFPDTYIPVHKT